MRFLFHPMLVHFPIALYYFEFLLIALWLLKKEETYLRFAFLAFKVAYVLMIAAMIAGYIDANGINSRVLRHFTAAVSTFLVSSVRGFLWFRMRKSGTWNPWILGAGSVIGIILVSITGDLGGDMVFNS